ncbi:hypothetical protein Pla123a_19240 [Posidoniimonas polymericola]|uniref:Uncharacterized protein n=1 Tax=Posidoniimonas polymericola TaxID=2528002 RepID=A0A5C5YR98_9BACT|nr:hypothetical protein [Posidoniimonas polymericola]TWT77267.1 hypothetical protein Pla123a_19240 [Posidoniimonas polymericola]
MKAGKLAGRLVAAGIVAFTLGRTVSANGDLGGCGSDRWEVACGDSVESSRVRHDPVVGMFGDGGLVNPRANPLNGGLQVFFQNHAYKAAENNTALPQDRVGFNFNAMQDVYSGQSGGPVENDIYEYRLFGEKTLADGRLSVDLMVPFYTTSVYDYDPLDLALNGPSTDGSFGDLAFGFKWLVHESCASACSLGLRIEAPTGEEMVARGALSSFYTSLDDDVWHFTPYVANLWTPSDRTFIQSFLSYRLTSSSLQSSSGASSIREQSYFMGDISAGYWLFRNRCGRRLTGLATVLELHYTGAWDRETALNSGIAVDTSTNSIYGRTDRLSLTAGLSAFFGPRCSAGVAVAVPLRSKEVGIAGPAVVATDRAYDWAVLTQLTYYYGR